MKISGKILISKIKDSQEFNFKRTEKVGWGYLSWVNKVGDIKTYTNKQFAVFGDNIDIIANNLNKVFHIEGILRTEYYKDKEGNKRGAEKVIINNAVVYEKTQTQEESIAQINKMIADNEQKDINLDDLDDSIPF